MRGAIRSLISDNQNGFVGGRQILNALLMANELDDSRIKERIARVICKLVTKKAYDHVNGEFLIYILQRMGFGDKQMGSIHQCISTTFPVLVNDSPLRLIFCL